MATPKITNLDNVNKTYMADGVQYALDPSTNRFAIASTIKPVPNATIQNASPITIPPTNISQLPQQLPQTQDYTNAQAENKTVEQNLTQQNLDLLKLYNEASGKSADQLALEQQQGIPQISQKVLDLQALADQKALEYNLTPYSLQGQGRGITTGILRGQEAVKQRQLAVEGIFANAQLKAAQGNLQLAQSQVDRALSLKYDPILAKIDAQKQIIENSKFMLSRSDKKLADAKQAELDRQKQDIADKKEMEKSLQTLAFTVSKNYPNVSPSVLSSITNAKTFNDAVIAASPFMQSLADKADLDYKLAQTAEIYNKIKNDTSIGTDPASALAYAQQYASTGQIPSGMPKGSFGAIAQYAKELPRPTGEIVNRATGVKPASSEAQVTAMSALVSAVELAKQLQELDKQRWGGLVAGTVGKVVGSADQQRYLDLRKQIVDLLARARTGAAMTASEEKFYGDMLPGRFSEPLALGADSSVKINNFVNNLSKDLQSKANAQGWSIYGYSTVKTDDGIERTVGSIIQSPDGRTGRVNPDGSITLIQ